MTFARRLWALRGGPGAQLVRPGCPISAVTSAIHHNLVASAPQPVSLRLVVDGRPAPPAEIGRPTLYTLLEGNDYSEHLLAVQADTSGLSLFSATFG